MASAGTTHGSRLSWPYLGGTCILWGEKARSYTLKSLKFPPCLVSWFSSAWKMPLLQDLVEASRLCKYCSLDWKIDEIVSQDYLLMALGDPSLALSTELGTFGLLRPKGHVEKRAGQGDSAVCKVAFDVRITKHWAHISCVTLSPLASKTLPGWELWRRGCMLNRSKQPCLGDLLVSSIPFPWHISYKYPKPAQRLGL